MTRILGVHGIGNLQVGVESEAAAVILCGRWKAGLLQSLTHGVEADIRVAYYAHHLANGIAQGNDELDQLEPAAEQLVMAWVKALGAKSGYGQGRVGTPVRQAADWMARKYGLDYRLVRILVTRFAGDVHRYLNVPVCRSAARDTVAAEIRSSLPHIIIAHSLGSVVAYEALFRNQDIPVELFLTIGSPLAMPDVIYENLDPSPRNGKGMRPPGVKRWINIADPGDFIAVPRWLCRQFDGVNGDLEAPIGTFKFHHAVGYLACSATAGILASYVDPL